MIKAAVVGVGYLGKFHAEKYARSQHADLIAVVDTDADKARKVGKKFRCEWCTDYKDLPELGVQCASIVCDTSAHYEVAKWLLANGIDVLVEKPITKTTKEARDLIHLAEKSGRIFQAGHLERFNPAFREVQKVLTRPWFFEVRRISPFAGRGHDVDVVLDLMIHDIDIITFLVGRPVEKVEAVGIPVLTGSVDIANARLTFEGGTVANVSASRAAFQSERTIRVFQPDVYVSLDFEKKKLKVCTKDPEIKGVGGMPKIHVDERKVRERDALDDEIHAFLKSVRERSAPEVSGWDGLRALEVVEQIRSAFRDSFIALDGDGEAMKQVGNLNFL